MCADMKLRQTFPYSLLMLLLNPVFALADNTVFALADNAVVATAMMPATAPLATHYREKDSADGQRKAQRECATLHMQYDKLDGYRQCIEKQQLSYAESDWCPQVKEFCDAQWYPFGGKQQCFTERGCPQE